MEMIRIGKIVNTHGVQGEVKILSLTDFPERFKLLENVTLKRDNHSCTLTVERVRFHKNNILMSFAEWSSMNDALPWKEAYVCIPKEDRMTLPTDRFYIDDLIGISVYEGDKHLGEIKDVLQPGANDVYVIACQDGKEIYFPALKALVKEIDFESKSMQVIIPEGLVD